MHSFAISFITSPIHHTMKNKVVILTHTGDDFGTLSTLKAINEAGGIAIRFNCDHYPSDTLQLSSCFINGKWQRLLFDGQEWHDMRDVCAVWFRRASNIGEKSLMEIDPLYRHAAIQEATRAFDDFFYTLDAFMLNPPHLTPVFYAKEWQLEIASSLGWRIPETCITNSFEQLQELLKRHNKGFIAKPLTSYFVNHESQKGATLFATFVQPEQVESFEGISLSPMIFQEPIPKKLELRIPVVGDKIWAYSIDSQSNKNAIHDWRRAGLEMVKQWQPYELPSHIKEKIHAFMQKMGCIYGSFDVIVTPDDDYVFLEINTDGEFFWLDELSGYQISRAFAQMLLTGKA